MKMNDEDESWHHDVSSDLGSLSHRPKNYRRFLGLRICRSANWIRAIEGYLLIGILDLK
jgi:hypothetical protein